MLSYMESLGWFIFRFESSNYFVFALDFLAAVDFFAPEDFLGAALDFFAINNPPY